MAYTTTVARFFEQHLPAFAGVRFEIGSDVFGAEEPRVIVRATAGDFMALVEGRMSASDGMLTERLHVAGDVVVVGQVLAALEKIAR